MYQMKLPVNMKYFIRKWEISLLSAMILVISFRNNKAWLQAKNISHKHVKCRFGFETIAANIVITASN